jgi:hypothetical protein
MINDIDADMCILLKFKCCITYLSCAVPFVLFAGNAMKDFFSVIER